MMLPWSPHRQHQKLMQIPMHSMDVYTLTMLTKVQNFYTRITTLHSDYLSSSQKLWQWTPLKFYSLAPGFELAWYKRCCFKANSSFSVQILLLSKCGFKIHSFSAFQILVIFLPPIPFYSSLSYFPQFFSWVQTLTCTLGWQ